MTEFHPPSPYDRDEVITELGEQFLEFFVRVFFPKVFDVHIGELHGFGPKLALSFLTGLEVAHKSTNQITKTQ